MNERFESVWDALEDTPEMAAEMRSRSELLAALQLRIRARGWTQTEAAQQLGVTQPRISDLMRGRVQRFSIDTLVGMLAKTGASVSWVIEEQVAA